MELDLAYYGNPILRKKGEPIEEITEEFRELVAGMVETMEKHNGIGLAAPQVHRSLRLFITQVPQENENGKFEDGELRVYINPEILEVSDESSTLDEGCLSIPGLRGHVKRPVRARVRARDLDGNSFEVTVEGLEARCVLHENDHINGVLFIDRIRGKARKELEPKLKKLKKISKKST